MDTPSFILVLHNIRSAHNVGALFRTADGVGNTSVVLSGYTPHPFDKFKRPQKELIKTALGAHETVLWEVAENLASYLEQKRREGWLTVALECGGESVPYTTLPRHKKYLCILGNEVEGLSQEVLHRVDVVADIPMRGSKESLNVATAGAVALFMLRDRTS